MTRLLGLPPSIAHPPRGRPLARSPATRCRLAWHRCRASRVGLPLQGLLAYFLLQKLFYVVYCRKKTLNDRQSRRVNQQSLLWRGLPQCGARQWLQGVTYSQCAPCGYRDGPTPGEILVQREGTG